MEQENHVADMKSWLLADVPQDDRRVELIRRDAIRLERPAIAPTTTKVAVSDGLLAETTVGSPGRASQRWWQQRS